MHRAQIQFDKRQLSELKRLAGGEDISVAELVRRAVDEYLASRPSRGTSARDRALAVAGRFKSGRTDVAKEHDAHLGEAFKS